MLSLRSTSALGILGACDKGSERTANAQPVAVALPTEAAPVAAGHEAGEHPYTAPHGGQVATTSGGHRELVATREGQFHGVRPVEGATGTIKVAGAGYAHVARARWRPPRGQGAAIPGEHATAVATVKVGGKVETGRFTLEKRQK